jgi:hypothetical protein
MSYRSPLGFRIIGTTIFLGVLICAAAAVPGTMQTNLPEDLSATTVDPFKLSDGHVLVLLFVRTDCPISNRYVPAIQRLSYEFQGKANFWLIYPDPSESAAIIRTHLERFHYAIPALRDIHHVLVNRARATITPETAVFNASGKLVYHGRIDNWYEDFGRSRPAPTTHELEDAIQNTLAGKSTMPDHANAVGCYISDLK